MAPPRAGWRDSARPSSGTVRAPSPPGHLAQPARRTLLTRQATLDHLLVVYRTRTAFSLASSSATDHRGEAQL